MTDLKIDTSDLTLYANQLKGAARTIDYNVRGIVNKTAGLIHRHARKIVPVDTGNLQESIFRTPPRGARGTVSAFVWADTDYASYVEYGTSRMGPQPYMRPAAEKYRKPFEEALGTLGEMLLGGRSALAGSINVEQPEGAIEWSS